MQRLNPRALASAALALGLLPQFCCAAAPTGSAPVARIPFVVGLSTVRAVSTPEGDYETLRVIESIDATGYRMVASGEAPADDGSGPLEVRITRAVRATDELHARKIRNYFHTGDAETFSGTVPGVSAAVINDLRTGGKAQLTYLDVGPVFGMSMVRRELTGLLARVAQGPATLTVLVNGHNAELPVIHAKGTLADGEDREDFEYWLLDDPGNPIVLRSSGAGSSSAVVKIEYPEPKNAPTSIERSLAANEVAEVYGIYFSFARADIRPQSERVLKEIATILKANPHWKLRIDGHTDGIGNDASNLDLSKRRAAAVKNALVSRYGIDAARLTTGGYGESSPKATNATPEGRARNRRVELRRE
jgi:outer membrane protein OmpA-like peptidoglycan-associated protein